MSVKIRQIFCDYCPHSTRHLVSKLDQIFLRQGLSATGDLRIVYLCPNCRYLAHASLPKRVTRWVGDSEYPDGLVLFVLELRCERENCGTHLTVQIAFVGKI